MQKLKAICRGYAPWALVIGCLLGIEMVHDGLAQDARPAVQARQTAPASRQPDTLDELKSAIQGYTEYRNFTCTGEVRDALYNKPIEGAKVTILKLVSPQRRREGDAKVLKRIETETDADGKYTFELPTDHAFVPAPSASTISARTASQRFDSASFRAGTRRSETPFLPLEIQIQHPDYATACTSSKIYIQAVQFPPPAVPEGFSLPATPPDPAQRAVAVIELQPGKEVTGVLQSTEGKPLAAVKVMAFSQAPKNERGANGGGQAYPKSKDVVTSDAAGRFRVNMITPGEGMLMLIPSDGHHGALTRVVYDQRGDLGAIQLPAGQIVKGHVLRSDGKPLAGVFVNAIRWTPMEGKYSDVMVSHQTERAAETDDGGNFLIGALAPGDYRIAPTESFLDSGVDPHDWPDERPVPGIFVPQKIAIAADHSPAPLEIRALALVTIEGRMNSNVVGNRNPVALNGQPATPTPRTASYSPVVDGKIGEFTYRQRIRLEDDGSFSAQAPKGLTEAVLLPMVSANGSGRIFSTALRWRIGKDAEFQTEAQIELRTLEKDIRDLEIDLSRDPTAGAKGRGGLGGQADPANPFGPIDEDANPFRGPAILPPKP